MKWSKPGPVATLVGICPWSAATASVMNFLPGPTPSVLLFPGAAQGEQ